MICHKVPLNQTSTKNCFNATILERDQKSTNQNHLVILNFYEQFRWFQVVWSFRWNVVWVLEDNYIYIQYNEKYINNADIRLIWWIIVNHYQCLTSISFILISVAFHRNCSDFCRYSKINFLANSFLFLVRILLYRFISNNYISPSFMQCWN